jgi:predicted RNA-binding protein with PUA-like domain
MNRWLVKSDPDDYSARDLERDGRTVWSGVRNAAALLHLRKMRPGDAVLVYHTGVERTVVARAKIASLPRPDADDPGRKAVVIDVAFDGWLKAPVTLAQIRSDPAFADFALVRISRLSVMPVSVAQWQRILKLSNEQQDR